MRKIKKKIIKSKSASKRISRLKSSLKLKKPIRKNPYKFTRSLYDILSIDRGASLKEIKSAYRKLQFQYQQEAQRSDIGRDKLQEINAAYEILSDSELRRDYDLYGKTQGRRFVPEDPKPKSKPNFGDDFTGGTHTKQDNLNEGINFLLETWQNNDIEWVKGNLNNVILDPSDFKIFGYQLANNVISFRINLHKNLIDVHLCNIQMTNNYWYAIFRGEFLTLDTEIYPDGNSPSGPRTVVKGVRYKFDKKDFIGFTIGMENYYQKIPILSKIVEIAFGKFVYLIGTSMGRRKKEHLISEVKRLILNDFLGNVRII